MEHTVTEMIIAGAIFVGAYALIIWDKIDRTIIALSGAALMVLVRILEQEAAFREIDFHTLTLLISMMVIVMITKRCGIFEYLAIKTVKIAKGEPVKIIMLLSIITGVLSAFLDNVTTILLILPVTFSVINELHISPVPFIMSEVFASNIGGTATLIGDPPNIMIGSAVGLKFMDFVANEAAVIAVILLITTYIYATVYKKHLTTTEEAKKKVMLLDENSAITDRKLMRKSLIVIAITIFCFIIQGSIGMESSSIAMIGAVALLFICGLSVEEILTEVEWKTIFFFTGLFIIVGGVKEVGLIKLLAQGVLDITGGNLAATTMAILWVSAIASAFIDNIPFVATMIPMIKDMGALSGINLNPLWWALSLGACLGGNGTIIGASANVVATGMCERQGRKITFAEYFKVAFPTMLLTIVISTVYLYVFYLM